MPIVSDVGPIWITHPVLLRAHRVIEEPILASQRQLWSKHAGVSRRVAPGVEKLVAIFQYKVFRKRS
jgi:hypothetical protein